MSNLNDRILIVSILKAFAEKINSKKISMYINTQEALRTKIYGQRNNFIGTSEQIYSAINAKDFDIYIYNELITQYFNGQDEIMSKVMDDTTSYIDESNNIKLNDFEINDCNDEKYVLKKINRD